MTKRPTFSPELIDQVRAGPADGAVVIAKKLARADAADPDIGRFLEYLARDIENDPAQVRLVPKSLVARGTNLVKGVKVDLDGMLPAD